LRVPVEDTVFSRVPLPTLANSYTAVLDAAPQAERSAQATNMPAGAKAPGWILFCFIPL
jgi:hypothetical protein